MTKSKVNAAGNYTKPGMRKALFEKIKAAPAQGTKAGQWSAPTDSEVSDGQVSRLDPQGGQEPRRWA